MLFVTKHVVHRTNRVKRQYGDMQISKHQADMALGPLVPRACKEEACGLLDYRVR